MIFKRKCPVVVFCFIYAFIFDHIMQLAISYFPNQGLKLDPPAVEVGSPHNWTPRGTRKFEYA